VGAGVALDNRKAFELAGESAKAGNKEGLATLGYLTESGRGTTADVPAAMKLHRQAAEAGSGIGQAALGRLLISGKGVAHDPVEGRKWLESSVLRGNANGMGNLGVVLLQGVGGDRDVSRGVELLNRAAALGDVDATENLGLLYGRGQLVPRDVALSKQWLQKASALGAGRAHFMLASTLLSEQRDADNCREVVRLLRLALAKNVPEAANLAGHLHYEGRCVAAGNATALSWLLIAQALGFTGAAEGVAQLRGELGEQGAREAENRARQCMQGGIAACL
jgi:uncharacterized protein